MPILAPFDSDPLLTHSLTPRSITKVIKQKHHHSKATWEVREKCTRGKPNRRLHVLRFRTFGLG